MRQYFMGFCSCIIAAAMSISVHAAEPANDIIDELQSYGIIEQTDDLRLDDNLTRAEAVKILCSAGDFEVGHVRALHFFPDVPTTHWAAKYISAAYEDSIIHGDENGMFNPESNITYQDFEKMAVCILGYGNLAYQSKGYPDGYLEYAKNLGLNYGMTFDNKAAITRANAMIIIHNLLDVPVRVYMQTSLDEDGIETDIYQLRDGIHFPFESFRTRLKDIN